MRRVDFLIRQIRRATENEDVSDTIGISDAEILQYLNDAQTRLQSKIADHHSTIFVRETILDIVANQEAYDLPTNALLGNRVTSVEFSRTGNVDDYLKLELSSLHNRSTNVTGIPWQYIRRSGQVLLNPLPTGTGKIRLQYVRKIRDLDTRRGTVASATLNSTNKTITELKLDTSVFLDSTSLEEADYCTIVNKFGAIRMKAVPVDSVNTSTGIVTLSAAFNYESGETISTGDYIVTGRESSTHSELPDICERYLLSYCQTKMLGRDSSADTQAQLLELTSMERDISAIFADPDDDVKYVPIINSPWDEG